MFVSLVIKLVNKIQYFIWQNYLLELSESSLFLATQRTKWILGICSHLRKKSFSVSIFTYSDGIQRFTSHHIETSANQLIGFYIMAITFPCWVCIQEIIRPEKILFQTVLYAVFSTESEESPSLVFLKYV